MSQTIISLLSFLVALAILIAVHEFGHFWVARRLGIKVLRFSLGFGKPLISWRDKHDTEYAIAAIPLGGYVKMLDEADEATSEADRSKAFKSKSVWTRIAVVVAGPLFNLFFAVLLYWTMFLVGIQSIAPVIGAVNPNSIAADAGLKPLSEITAIANKPTHSWRAVRIALISHVGTSRALAISTLDKNTGFITTKFLDLRTWKLDSEQPNPLASIGIEPYIPKIPPIVQRVLPGAAQKAGLRPGDKIISLDGADITDWREFVKLVQANPGKTLPLIIERQQQRKQLTITPVTFQDKSGMNYGVIGVQSQPVEWPADLIRTQKYSVLSGWIPAIKQTVYISGMTLKLLGKMISGHVPLKSISGPVGIAIGAGQSASIGFSYYLSFLALVSISLGILNFLPIPVLDGGHLFFYLIEAVTGKPVPDRIWQISFKLGFVFLIGLMIFALLNDLMRLFA